jgi:hypothetical protein
LILKKKTILSKFWSSLSNDTASYLQQHRCEKFKSSKERSKFKPGESIIVYCLTKDDIMRTQKWRKVRRYKGGETYEKRVLYTLLLAAIYIYNEHVTTTDAEKNHVPNCSFLSWKSNFSLWLLTAYLQVTKRGGEGKPRLRNSACSYVQ